MSLLSKTLFQQLTLVSNRKEEDEEYMKSSKIQWSIHQRVFAQGCFPMTFITVNDSYLLCCITPDFGASCFSISSRTTCTVLYFIYSVDIPINLVSRYLTITQKIKHGNKNELLLDCPQGPQNVKNDAFLCHYQLLDCLLDRKNQKKYSSQHNLPTSQRHKENELTRGWLKNIKVT